MLKRLTCRLLRTFASKRLQAGLALDKYSCAMVSAGMKVAAIYLKGLEAIWLLRAFATETIVGLVFGLNRTKDYKTNSYLIFGILQNERERELKYFDRKDLLAFY